MIIKSSCASLEYKKNDVLITLINYVTKSAFMLGAQKDLSRGSKVEQQLSNNKRYNNKLMCCK